MGRSNELKGKKTMAPGSNPAKKWVMIIDVELCHDCNNCFLACKDEHVDNDFPGYAASQPRHGHRWIDIMAKERGQFPLIDVVYRPTPCQHCQDAPCQKAARDGAIYKRQDGIVMIDPVKARGQEHLVKACPYGAIWWNEEKKLPQKCTFCAHLLDQGWTQTRCVQACPTGALSIQKLDDTELAAVSESGNLEILSPDFRSTPLVRYRNLERFETCFIAGSVASLIGGVEECIKGANAVATDASGNRAGQAVADIFGDFRIDGLPGGSYDLEISAPGYRTQAMAINLKESVTVGVVRLGAD